MTWSQGVPAQQAGHLCTGMSMGHEAGCQNKRKARPVVDPNLPEPSQLPHPPRSGRAVQTQRHPTVLSTVLGDTIAPRVKSSRTSVGTWQGEERVELEGDTLSFSEPVECHRGACV